MKKRNLKSLKLNKKSISQLQDNSVKGGGSTHCTEEDTCWLTTRGPYICNDCTL